MNNPYLIKDKNYLENMVTCAILENKLQNLGTGIFNTGTGVVNTTCS